METPHLTQSSDDEVGENASLFSNGAPSSLLLSPSPSSASSSSSVFSPAAAPTNGLGVAGSSGLAADEELSPELIHQGWRKCFSKRENRHYFFNRVTNQALWEIPQFDPFSDPLGIESDLTPISPTTPTSTSPREKRSLDSPPSSAAKRLQSTAISGPVPAPPAPPGTAPAVGPAGLPPAPWDLEIPTNVVLFERGAFIRLHPTPEVEQQRCSFAFRLRSQFVDLCLARSHIEAPKEAFNRWLMERKVVDRGSDPLLPSNCFPEMSRPLYHEIMNNIPIRLVRPKCTADARKQLTRYAEGAKKLIEANTCVRSEARKIVKWSAEEVFSWIRSGGAASCEEYERRLAHMRNQCQPHLVEAMRENVEKICAKLYRLSCEYAGKLRAKELQYVTDKLKQQPLPGFGCVRLTAPPKRVFAYPAQLAYRAFPASGNGDTPQAPSTPTNVAAIHCGLNEKDGCMILRYNGESVRLRREYLHKLELLYRVSCWDDKKLDHFAARVWCMLRRYQTYWGVASLMASVNSLPPLSAELALPIRAFECLKRQFGVTFECFASPLNTYFRQYCSTFVDTDGYFGSNGSFLHFAPLTGSMVAFPPFCEPLLEAAFEHMDRLLAGTQEPLSFVVFLELNEQPCTSRSVHKLGKSRFKRKQFLLPPMAFEVRSGMQFLYDPLACNQKSSATLMVVFLQNDSGFVKYAPTPEKVELLVEALKVPPELEGMMSPASSASQPEERGPPPPLVIDGPSIVDV